MAELDPDEGDIAEIWVRKLPDNTLIFTWLGLPWAFFRVAYDVVDILAVGYLPWAVTEVAYTPDHIIFRRSEFVHHLN